MALRDTLNRPVIGKVKTWQVAAGAALLGVAYIVHKRRQAGSAVSTLASSTVPYQSPYDTGIPSGGGGGGGGQVPGLGQLAGAGTTPVSAAPPTESQPQQQAQVAAQTGSPIDFSRLASGSGMSFVPTGSDSSGNPLGNYVTAGNIPPGVPEVLASSGVPAGGGSAPPQPLYWNPYLSTYQATPVSQPSPGSFVGSTPYSAPATASASTLGPGQVVK